MGTFLRRCSAAALCGAVIAADVSFPVFAESGCGGEKISYCETLDTQQAAVINAVNSAVLKPHDSYSLYNIKGETPYLADTYYITAGDKQIIDEFAETHFTAEMTNYDKIAYTIDWLNENVTYASGDLYDEICADSWAKACFSKRMGQCLQYNGALAEMLAYMGYDVYMLEMWLGYDTNQHFRAEVNIDGQAYSLEAGNKGQSGSGWKWTFTPTESSIK